MWNISDGRTTNRQANLFKQICSRNLRQDFAYKFTTFVKYFQPINFKCNLKRSKSQQNANSKNIHTKIQKIKKCHRSVANKLQASPK